MKRATIKDVARDAGVSIATVSRVVNKSRYVSPDIERRVRDAVEKSEYYPDSIARGMRGSATSLIGFIVSDISNAHFMAIAKAIESIINTKHFNLVVCSTENDEVKEKEYIKALLSKKVAAVILNTTGKNDEFVARVSRQIPVLLVYRRIRHGQFHGDVVGFNNRKGAFDLTRHLLEMGHRRIGVVNGPPGLSTSQERLEGYRRAMQEFGAPTNARLEYSGDFTEGTGFEAAAFFMRMSAPPSALLAMNNAMTMGALRYLRMHGIGVPKDVSVACFGDIEDAEIIYVQPTFVTQSPWIIGAKAGELVLERIQNQGGPNQEVVFESILRSGNSVARVR